MNFYEPLLPHHSQERAEGEFDVWQATWSKIPQKDRPSTAISTLSKCDKQSFPIIHRLLSILAIQPVSTASAERSFSNLRALKTWLRNRLGEEKLTGLALMAMNRDKLTLDD